MVNTVTEIHRDHGSEPPQVRFTPEELKVWQECMKSSSVVLPTLISMALGYGICKVTPFRAKAKYIAIATGALELITNRISISAKCISKVASMPDSNLKERLREAKLYSNTSRSLHYKGFQPLDIKSDAQTSEQPEIVFDDYPSMNAYDTYSSFNDSSDFQASSEETDLTEPINLQKSVSYDELRHKNREEFYNKKKQWYTRGEQSTTRNEAPQEIPHRQEPSSNIPPMQQRNKYGDVWG